MGHRSLAYNMGRPNWFQRNLHDYNWFVLQDGGSVLHQVLRCSLMARVAWCWNLVLENNNSSISGNKQLRCFRSTLIRCFRRFNR
jgi:hypothetical protein